MLIKMNDVDSLNKALSKEQIALVVFSSDTCSVCAPFKLKLYRSLESVDNVNVYQIDVDDSPAVALNWQVFSVPFVILFVEGKETNRYSAAVDIIEIISAIDRYQSILSS